VWKLRNTEARHKHKHEIREERIGFLKEVRLAYIVYVYICIYTVVTYLLVATTSLVGDLGNDVPPETPWAFICVT